jgi:hypothetical protein
MAKHLKFTQLLGDWGLINLLQFGWVLLFDTSCLPQAYMHVLLNHQDIRGEFTAKIYDPLFCFVREKERKLSLVQLEAVFKQH